MNEPGISAAAAAAPKATQLLLFEVLPRALRTSHFNNNNNHMKSPTLNFN